MIRYHFTSSRRFATNRYAYVRTYASVHLCFVFFSVKLSSSLHWASCPSIGLLVSCELTTQSNVYFYASTENFHSVHCIHNVVDLRPASCRPGFVRDKLINCEEVKFWNLQKFVCTDCPLCVQILWQLANKVLYCVCIFSQKTWQRERWFASEDHYWWAVYDWHDVQRSFIKIQETGNSGGVWMYFMTYTQCSKSIPLILFAVAFLAYLEHHALMQWEFLIYKQRLQCSTVVRNTVVRATIKVSQQSAEQVVNCSSSSVRRIKFSEVPVY